MSPTTRPRSSPWLRLGLVLILVLAGVGAVALGGLERLQPDALAEALRARGAAGPALFVLLFAGLQALGAPGILFLVTSSALWPESALFLNWAGAVGAGVVGFVFARWIARDWASAHLPARARRFDARLAESGWRSVIWVRLVLFLFTPSHWALGLSAVSFRDMLLGSVIGFLPGTLFYTFVGVNAFRWLAEQPREVWLGLAGATAVLLLGWQLLRRQRAAAGRSG